jgi:gliding motility-associated-like protein
MKKLYLIVSLFLVSLFVQAQSVSDCNGAIQICQDVYSETSSTTTSGQLFEPTGSCNQGVETSSMWYTFTVTQTGNMGFILSPNNVNDDYDWGMFNITNGGCAGISSGTSPEVSCNSYGLFFNSGSTGISSSNGGTGNSNGPGDINGPAFNSDLSVTAGQTYALVVMNWSNSPNGYTIDFSNSSASLYDNVAPTVTSIAASCSTPGIQITFSENLVTTSIQNSDFLITGPNGNITINSVTLGSPNAPGNSNITLIPATSPLPAGDYTLSLTSNAGFVNDPCGNSAVGDFTFTVAPNLTTIDLGPDLIICPDSSANLIASGNFTSVQWTGGPSSSNYTVNTAGNYQATATMNGCSATDVVNVSVLSLPNWTLGNDTTICNDHQAVITNAQTIVWEDGTTGNSFSVMNSGYVEATYTYQFCPIIDSILVSLETAPVLNFGNDTILCPSDQLILNSNLPVSWNNSPSSSNSYTVTNSQEVTAVYSDGVCFATDTLLVTYVPPLHMPITSHYEICSLDSLHLNAGGVGSITWSTGDTIATTVFAEEGSYWVKIQNSCESLLQHFILQINDCENYAYVPNSFTPNSDGINDVWQPILNNVLEAQTRVFNRWGDEIYYSNSTNPLWIGDVHQGQYFAADGVYSYLIEIKFKNSEAKTLFGHVTLVR